MKENNTMPMLVRHNVWYSQGRTAAIHSSVVAKVLCSTSRTIGVNEAINLMCSKELIVKPRLSVSVPGIRSNYGHRIKTDLHTDPCNIAFC